VEAPVPTAPPVATAALAANPAVPPAFDPNRYEPMSVRAQHSRVPVIMYHDIIEKRGRGSVWFDCTRAEFEAQMQWLAEQGAQPISLETLHRHLTRGESVPVNAVVLTFDDNYQGFYDNAYPVLKQYNFPAAMFVHTNFVGDKSGAHPKMDWDTLRALDREGLVTIASHTLSHPDDMSTLPVERQDEEMTRSKALLEEKLGHPVPYFAYPNGKGDQDTFDAARRAGYTMAFTIANGPAEQSPGILAVNRYVHTRLEQAWKDCQDALLAAPATVFERNLAPGPVRLEVGEFEGVKLGVVRGGMPATRRAASGGRQSVGEFVKEAGGIAGMNGTFFANAALRGTDNAMIGPCMTGNERLFLPEEAAYRLPKLVNRPLVFWGPTRIAVVPFQPGYMNEPDPLTALIPDLTDVFLAGAWIVHNGVPRTREEMAPHAVGDFMDPRRRAFFGVTDGGEVLLGGTLEVVSTEKLAQAAAAAGAAEGRAARLGLLDLDRFRRQDHRHRAHGAEPAVPPGPARDRAVGHAGAAPRPRSGEGVREGRSGRGGDLGGPGPGRGARPEAA
jgi:peptidoglycan/xylan/chitin deacetylase (PgdA/CDA1 family)